MNIKSDWISVDTRLPYNHERCLFFNGFTIHVGWRDGKNWMLPRTLNPSTPATHWMPLPLPPKTESARSRVDF